MFVYLCTLRPRNHSSRRNSVRVGNAAACLRGGEGDGPLWDIMGRNIKNPVPRTAQRRDSPPEHRLQRSVHRASKWAALGLYGTEYKKSRPTYPTGTRRILPLACLFGNRLRILRAANKLSFAAETVRHAQAGNVGTMQSSAPSLLRYIAAAAAASIYSRREDHAEPRALCLAVHIPTYRVKAIRAQHRICTAWIEQ